MINYSLLLPEIFLAGLGLLLLLLDISPMKTRRMATVGFIGALITLWAVQRNFGVTADIWSDTIRVDNFAQFVKVVYLVVFASIFLFSEEYLEKRNVRVGEFYVLITFATLGGFLMASSLHLITIYLGLELLAIASYILAGMLKDDDLSNEASIKFFLMGALSSGMVLYGFSLLYGLTGSIFLPEIAKGLAASPNIGLATAAAVLTIAGLGFKVAAVPFHMWAPDTYQGAPSPISAFLITASEAAGFAVLLRVLLVGFAPLIAEWQMIIAVIALVTMTYGNVTAIVQNKTKRMLAYSAIAQAGYLLVGLAVATDASVQALLFYMLAYAFMTIGAFIVVIVLSNQIDTEEIDDFKGLAAKSPVFAGAMTFLLLSLIGIPPTAGFLGKFTLVRSAVDGGFLWLALALMLNSAISVPYYYRIIKNMYLNDSEKDVQPLQSRLGVKVALGVTVAGTVILGIFPEPLIRFLTNIKIM